VSRLYDRVFARGTISPQGRPHALAGRRNLEGAPVLAADDIAEYFFAHAAKGPGEWRPVTDMPSIAPPFDRFFVETAMPTSLSPAWQRTLEDYPQLLRAPSGAGARWLLEGELFLQLRWAKKILSGSQGIAAVVASDGTLCPTAAGVGAYKAWLAPQALEPPPESPRHAEIAGYSLSERRKALGAGSLTFSLPLFLTLSFCSCKNVVLADKHPDEQRSRRHKKKHKRPLISFKTLRIEGMREVLRTEGRIEEGGIRRALHLCRGHFRTYTPERGGPFGRKIEAPYTEWVSPHLRGTPAEGVVAKDYKVSTASHERTPG
jgi:hypothetical protein